MEMHSEEEEELAEQEPVGNKEEDEPRPAAQDLLTYGGGVEDKSGDEQPGAGEEDDTDADTQNEASHEANTAEIQRTPKRHHSEAHQDKDAPEDGRSKRRRTAVRTPTPATTRPRRSCTRRHPYAITSRSTTLTRAEKDEFPEQNDNINYTVFVLHKLVLSAGVLKGIALGRLLVSEEWVRKSVADDVVHEPEDFALEHEEFNLSEVRARALTLRGQLFRGLTIVFVGDPDEGAVDEDEVASRRQRMEDLLSVAEINGATIRSAGSNIQPGDKRFLVGAWPYSGSRKGLLTSESFVQSAAQQRILFRGVPKQNR
ncbi:hypothetical protein B0H16DRAFT_1525497 [Mycena metata]|uniref:BRCT domain-containing protein n=1 Tax=Mycena metata TaxID=1033252 RepID=A0AAD7JH00_9AGAR|nr:hypothetical protein B0H16DRAFT_1525497 [Mycena metata]